MQFPGDKVSCRISSELSWLPTNVHFWLKKPKMFHIMEKTEECVCCAAAPQIVSSPHLDQNLLDTSSISEPSLNDNRHSL